METEHFAELDELDGDYWWFATRFDSVWRLGTKALQGAPTSVVDLGCGTGTFLSWLLTEKRIDKKRVLGFDGSELGLAAASRRGVPVRPLDLSRTDLAGVLDEPPDMFVMLDVLEHLPAPVDALRTVLRASKPGGILVVTVPALPVLWSSWDERLGHYRRYTASTLEVELNEAGWRVAELQYLFFGMLLPALLRRVLSKNSSRGDPGFPRLSATSNTMLTWLTKAEARLGRWLPAGTSLVAAAQCPPHGAAGGTTSAQVDPNGEPRLSNSSK